MSKACWECRALNEVADILDNKRVPINSKEREGRRGSVPYYGATGQVGWIDDYLFDEELVLLGEDGAPFLEPTKSKAYVVRGRSWVNNHAHVLRARNVPTGWLHNYLNSINYRDFVTGTTRLKLTQAEMRKIMVPIAPEATMHGVVAEIEKQFSRLDEAVAGLQRVKANSSMTDLGIDYNDYRYLPISLQEVMDIVVRGGDFFVSRGNGSLHLVGRGSAAKAPPLDVIFPDTMMRVRFTSLADVPEWVQALWSSRFIRIQIEARVKTTAGIYKIAQPELASICLPLPPLPEQHRIVAEVDRLLSIAREAEAEVEANLKRAQALRQAILTRAFQPAAS